GRLRTALILSEQRRPALVMSGDIKQLFARQPLIRVLDEDTIDELSGFSHFQRFPPGTILFREGDLPSLLFIVADGFVAARRLVAGMPSTASVSGSGAVMPLGSIVSDWACVLTVEVMDHSQIFMVPAASIRSLAETNPPFAFAVSVELATGYRQLINDATLHKTAQSTERLVHWLLSHADEDGRVNLPFSRGELASLLGMSTESMSRNLQALSRQGLEVSRAELRVRDRAALALALARQPLSATA
ncbi:helix-turn-helix domain-containing protein, partial [Nostoc sp. NIES-2111]